MSAVEDIIKVLEEKGSKDNVEGMAKFGMTLEKRLGVSVPDIRIIAKSAGKDHELALQLWQTGIAEARIVAALVDESAKITEEQMDDWVKDFNSWDVCDQVCMNLFDKVPFAWQKALEWSERKEEFVKRAAYALIACLAWHDKQAHDEKFIAFLPVIVRGADDERNFVKKAVSWALRHIGKRNKELNKAALDTARQIRMTGSCAAKWIASDVIKELESEAVQKKLA
jgi:3-methyladenine DNA glycosylase AlkD